MLLHYKQKKFLMKHLNEPAKTYVFVITRSEDVTQKTLEEVLTIYLIKTDLVEHYNLAIIVYRNKFYLSRFVDINKFRQLDFKYKHRVLILGEKKIDENIRKTYINKIDNFYSMNAYFDKFDYDLLTREKKKELRLNLLKSSMKREKFKKLFNFKFLKMKQSA